MLTMLKLPHHKNDIRQKLAKNTRMTHIALPRGQLHKRNYLGEFCGGYVCG